MALIGLLGIMLTRFPVFGVDIAHADRYMRLFQIGFIGALWINVSGLKLVIDQQRSIGKIGLRIFSLIALFIVGGYLLQSEILWRYHQSIINYKQNVVMAIRTYANNPSYDIGKYHDRCKNNFCRPSVDFLKENQLSIFREPSPGDSSDR